MCFILGQVLAWIARRRQGDVEAPAKGRTMRVVAFGVVGWLPVSLYFILVHTSWSWAYAIPDDKISGTLIALAFISQLGVLLLGYFWAADLLSRDSVSSAGLLALAGCAAYALAVILPGDVLTMIGTQKDFAAGVARPLWRSPRLIVELCASGAWMIFCLVMYRRWTVGERVPA